MRAITWLAAGLLLHIPALAQPPFDFHPLGVAPGADSSVPAAISGDGSIIVGSSPAPGGAAPPRPFRWTQPTGIIPLGLPPGATRGQALGLSADGSIVVGYTGSATASIAGRWTGLGWLPLPAPAGAAADGNAAYGASADGSIIVGNSIIAGTPRAWRSIGGAAPELLAEVTGHVGTIVAAISADGGTIVGYAGGPAAPVAAVRWDAAGHATLLPPAAAAYTRSFPSGVSADGSRIIGTADGGSSATQKPVLWTHGSPALLSTGVVPSTGAGSAIAANAAVRTGVLRFGAQGPYALLWRSEVINTWRPRDVLIAVGFNLSDWLIPSIPALSADGTVLAGAGIRNFTGRNEAFCAVINPPPRPPCYANCDGSTIPPVLNVNDFICFTVRFAARDFYANCDGTGVGQIFNVDDFICFQAAFPSGCP